MFFVDNHERLRSISIQFFPCKLGQKVFLFESFNLQENFDKRLEGWNKKSSEKVHQRQSFHAEHFDERDFC
jgi:hypothetical protein